MKHYNETPELNATGQPNFTMPPDPLTASRLKPQEGRAGALDLEDLLHSLRAALFAGNHPEAATMLASQMHVMNVAFNRLVMAGTNVDGADPYAINVAVRTQRRCQRTLEALERRMDKILGKQTDHKSALAQPDAPRGRARPRENDDWLTGGGT